MLIFTSLEGNKDADCTKRNGVLEKYQVEINHLYPSVMNLFVRIPHFSLIRPIKSKYQEVCSDHIGLKIQFNKICNLIKMYFLIWDCSKN